MKNKPVIFLIILFVLVWPSYAYTQYEAKESMEDALNAINYMSALGLNTQRVNDQYADAGIYFESGDFDKSVEASKKVLLLRDSATKLQLDLKKANETIRTAENLLLDVSAAKKTIGEATSEFEANNYENAYLLLQAAFLDLENLLENQWQAISGLILGLQDVSASKNLAFSKTGSILDELENSKETGFVGLDKIKNDAVSLNQSISGLLESYGYLEQLALNGFFTQKASDLIEEAKISIELGKFDRAYFLVAEVEKIWIDAFYVSEKKQQAEKIIGDIGAQGHDVHDAARILGEASASISGGDYPRAKAQIEDALGSAQRAKESELLLGIISKQRIKFNLMNYLREYWMFYLFFMIAVLAISYPAFNLAMKHILRGRKASLEKEQQVLTSMIKKLQEDYYKNKKLSRGAYEKVMEAHQERMLKIKESLPILDQKISQSEQNLSAFFVPLRKLNKYNGGNFK